LTVGLSGAEQFHCRGYLVLKMGFWVRDWLPTYFEATALEAFISLLRWGELASQQLAVQVPQGPRGPYVEGDNSTRNNNYFESIFIDIVEVATVLVHTAAVSLSLRFWDKNAQQCAGTDFISIERTSSPKSILISLYHLDVH